MRRFLVIIVMVWFVTIGNTFADPVNIGAKGGIDFTRIDMNKGDLTFGGWTLLGYNAGLFAEVNLNNFLSFQPEMQLTLKGDLGNKRVSNPNTYPLPYIEFPMLLKANIFSIRGIKVNLLAGPYLAFLLPGIYSDSEPYYSQGFLTGNYNNLDLGLVFGISFDLDNFILDARYEGGAQYIFNGLSNGTQVNGGANEAFIISSGYKFLRF